MATRNTRILGPPALCDACGRACMALHQAGIRCYHCNGGTFIHRGQWHYTDCTACGGDGWGCVPCKRTGVTAVRKNGQDVDRRTAFD